MRFVQIMQALKVTIVAFVLVFAPVSHAISMPSGHSMATSVSSETEVIVSAKGHLHGEKTVSKKQSSCDETSGQPKSKTYCCEMGCLSVATIANGVELYVSIPSVTQHHVTEQRLFSRTLGGLKRPPRF
jgi:hypothetical protein